MVKGNLCLDSMNLCTNITIKKNTFVDNDDLRSVIKISRSNLEWPHHFYREGLYCLHLLLKPGFKDGNTNLISE